MPREVVALVSADDLVAAVRVHADRIHDLLRRSGCGAEESVEVTEAYAFALIDALVNAPETVGDLAGWWFGRALELGRRLGETAAEPTAEVPTSVLAGTSGEAQVRAALAALPPTERAAVVLRDAYDLPTQAVAVALRMDVDEAAAVIATGRLAVVGHYDDRRPPTLAGHAGRTPADLGTLGRLVDGTLPPPRMVALRRHVATCATCEDVVEALAKGRRLAAGLPVIAMPDEAREAMLTRVAGRAMAVLPSVDEVLRVIEEEDEPHPALSPLVIVMAIALALVLGVALAAISTLDTGGGSAAPNPKAVLTAQPSFSVSPTPKARRTRVRPSATATASTPPAVITVTPTRTTSPTPTHTSVPVAAAIRLNPTSGPAGTAITVHGVGFTPGAAVEVSYTGTLGGSSTATVADGRGRFTAQVTASGTIPGNYRVSASDGTQTATARFDQTT